MTAATILSDDEPVSPPSERTLRGGDPDALGRIDHFDLLRELGGGGSGLTHPNIAKALGSTARGRGRAAP